MQKGTPCHDEGSKEKGWQFSSKQKNAIPYSVPRSLGQGIDVLHQGYGDKASLQLAPIQEFAEEKEQAESPQSIAALAKLVDNLLVVSSCAKIKYKALQQSFVYLMHEWGASLLKTHWDMDEKLLAGRAADAVGVLLKHWRKVASSEAAWQKATSKLDEADTQALWRLRKKTTFQQERGAVKRKLELKVSDVSMDSMGFPSMTGKEMASSSEEDSEEGQEEGSEEQRMESEKLPGLDDSPPPCLKKDWREQAMKRPATGSSPMKKPSAKEASKKPAAEVPTKAAAGPAKGLEESTEKVLIHQDTITIGGGKNQRYLQHVPGPGKSKKLIAAVTLSQASRTTKTKEQLVELLLPACKKPKATKQSVLAEREKLFTMHAK